MLLLLCAPGGMVDPRPALGCLSWITPSSESMPTVSVQIGIAWVSASVRRILSAQFRVVGFKHIGKRPGAALRQPCPRLCLGSLSPARHVSSEGNSGIGRLAGTLARHRTAPPHAAGFQPRPPEVCRHCMLSSVGPYARSQRSHGAMGSLQLLLLPSAHEQRKAQLFMSL